MQLSLDETTISVEEQEYQTYTDAYPRPAYWEATLSSRGVGDPKVVEGLSVGITGGEAVVDISLVRYGDSPDDALKALFEGMHEAGITL